MLGKFAMVAIMFAIASFGIYGVATGQITGIDYMTPKPVQIVR